MRVESRIESKNTPTHNTQFEKDVTGVGHFLSCPPPCCVLHTISKVLLVQLIIEYKGTGYDHLNTTTHRRLEHVWSTGGNTLFIFGTRIRFKYMYSLACL